MSNSTAGISNVERWVFAAWATGVLGCSTPALAAQPFASSTPVVDLDGKDSWVELPADLFTNGVVTEEGWVRWRSFGEDAAGVPIHLRVGAQRVNELGS